jgi:hypothetical protein
MCRISTLIGYFASGLPHYAVNFLGFQECVTASILQTPKGGGGFRDGWGESTTGGLPMTYTFKLSRRLARLRDASLLVAAIFTISCTSDDSTGPGSGQASDPNGISVAPGSVLVSTNEAVQFTASTLESGAFSTSSKGGRGRGRRTVVSLSVAPETLTVASGSPTNFVATAALSDGSTGNPSVTWVATGGTIDANGRYTAGGIAGAYAVSATAANGIADTASVIVTDNPPTVVGVSLSPTSASLPQGASKQFVAMGKSNTGSTVAVGARYAANGGTISADGLYQAGQTPGNFRVIATDTVTNLADTAAVIIEAPPATLQAIVLTPGTASLTIGGTQQFTVTGKMSDGSSASISVSWSASGGTVSSSGLYTAGSVAGSYRVIATDQGSRLADTATISITAPATAPTPPQAGDLPTPLRTVNVANSASLATAVQNAQPGDQIVMAPGSYSSDFTVSRSGTAQNPIVLTGPRTAILSGSAGVAQIYVTGSFWIFNGFRITNPVNSGVDVAGNYNIFEYLEIDHTGTTGMAVKTGLAGANPGTSVTGNEIRYNYIHDTGLFRADYGEGIYLGDGTCGCQRALNTHVHHNTIGPNVGAESIEAKVSADGNTIEFNTITGGTGVVIRSNNNVFNDNTMSAGGANGNALVGIGSDVAGVSATNNVFHRNIGSNLPFLFFNSSAASGSQIFCDNKPTAPTALGVTCTQ